MKITTPWLFLLGSRRAMEDAARHWRTALVVGGLLVLSAGLARNYDGEDLRHEPQWLAAPFGASIVTSLVLFAVYWWLAPGAVSRSAAVPPATTPSSGGEPPAEMALDDTSKPGHRLTWRMYVPFLGLYWLTAPLAWLYGIPYEMLVSPSDAVTANAITLSVVSLWRVALMARVAHVLLGCSLWRAFLLDLWLGICGIVAASFCGPKPVLDVMGGLRLTEAERQAGNLFGMTIFFGGIAVVMLAIPALMAAAKMRMPRLALGDLRRLLDTAALKRRSWPVTLTAVLALLAWAPALVTQQPKQRNRRVVEQAVERKEYAAAVDVLSGLTERDLPTPWAPPLGDSFNRADVVSGMTDAMRAAERPAPRFVRSAYFEWAGLVSTQAYYTRQDWLASLAQVDSNGAYYTAYTDALNKKPGASRRRLEWMLLQNDIISEQQREVIQGVVALLKTEEDAVEEDLKKPSKP